MCFSVALSACIMCSKHQSQIHGILLPWTLHPLNTGFPPPRSKVNLGCSSAWPSSLTLILRQGLFLRHGAQLLGQPGCRQTSGNLCVCRLGLGLQACAPTLAFYMGSEFQSPCACGQSVTDWPISSAFVLIFRDRVFLRGPGWPEPHSVYQAGIELTAAPMP